MATGQISNYAPKKVYCSECRHFQRDTEGNSYRRDTGEYFLGVSDIGCDPDHTYNKVRGYAKIFADKPRFCDSYLSK